MNDDNIIGIDFGSCFVRASVFIDKNVYLVKNNEYKEDIPAVLSFSNNRITIGENAKEDMLNNPQSCASRLKSMIGSTYEKKFSIESKDDLCLSPEELIAILLNQIKEDAQRMTNKIINQAVIAVPFSFTQQQRESIMIAAEIVKFHNIGIISETEALAIAYFFQNRPNRIKRILFIDVGGGKTEMSLIDVTRNNYAVISCFSETNFGGDNFTDSIFKYILANFKKKLENCKIDDVSLESLRDACEQAKCTLSKNSQANIKVRKFYEDLSIDEKLSRETFIEINQELFKRFEKQCAKIRRATDQHGFDDVILLGGSSIIPKIKEIVGKVFKKEPKLGIQMINSNEIVATGCLKYTWFKPLEPNNEYLRSIRKSREKVENIIKKSKININLDSLKNRVEYFASNFYKEIENLKINEIWKYTQFENCLNQDEKQSFVNIITTLKNIGDSNELASMNSTREVQTYYEKLKESTSFLIKHIYDCGSDSVFISKLYHSIKHLRAIAIDFGACLCRVGIFMNNSPILLPNEFDEFQTPTFICNGQIGEKALKNVSENDQFSYKLKAEFLKSTDDDKISLASIVFKYLSNIAVKYTGRADILFKNDFVFVIPFDCSKEEIKRFDAAVQMTGINRFTYLAENTACAIAYAFYKQFDQDENVMVIAIGAGRTSISFYIINQFNIKEKKVISVDDFNGDAFTEKIIDYCLSHVDYELREKIKENRYSFLRLRNACENAKIKLFETNNDTIRIRIFNMIDSIDFDVSINRQQFEDISYDLFQIFTTQMYNAIRYINSRELGVSRIVFVGNTCKIPRIKLIIRKLGLNCVFDEYDGNFVVEGASVYAAFLNKDKKAIFETFNFETENNNKFKFS